MQSVNVSGRAKEGICVRTFLVVVVVFWEEEPPEMVGAAAAATTHTQRENRDKEGFFLRRRKVSCLGGAFSWEYGAGADDGGSEIFSLHRTSEKTDS